MPALTPRIRTRSSIAIVSLAVAGAALLPRVALADGEGEACARAAEDTQSLRGRGKLVLATERVRACLRPICPAFVRADCARFADDLEASVPTIVVGATRASGGDLTDVRVTVDGAALTDRIDGLARPVDPGEHRVRFEAPGLPPFEKTIVVREGEKRRAVVAVFADPQHAETPATTASPGPSPWAIGFGATGVVLGGAGAYLALSGLSRYHDLSSGCGRDGSCATGDVSDARTRVWIGDGLIAGGVAAAAAALWIAIARPGDSSSARASIGLAPFAGGATGAIMGAF